MPPPPCTVEHWSSSELEPAARLAYWREVAHNWVDARPLAPGDDLDASWTLMRSERCLFGTKRSTAYEMRTGSQRHGGADAAAVGPPARAAPPRHLGF